MSFDAHKNFSYSTVATAPSPATSGTSLVVQAGDGAKFPTAPFNATVWPAGVQPTSDVAEIVRVTAKSTDTFTITRAQESSSARSIGAGDQIAATITAKTLTDIENAIAPTRQIFTASGTYTLPAGCKAILVECIGAGGGGGGTVATGAGQCAAGAGGGGGAYSASLISSPSATYTVTIGAAGTAGSGSTDGTAGGTTSFGTAVTAEGGQGGPHGILSIGTFPDTGSSPARGGLASNGTGDFKLDGENSRGGMLYSAGIPYSGAGGGAARGAGGRDGSTGTTIGGNPGRQYGGGGTGGVAIASAAAQSGGAGAAGVCVVTEYY